MTSDRKPNAGWECEDDPAAHENAILVAGEHTQATVASGCPAVEAFT